MYKKCKKSQENKKTKKIIQNKNLDCQMDIRETNSDYEMEKKIICNYSLLKKHYILLKILEGLLIFFIILDTGCQTYRSKQFIQI